MKKLLICALVIALLCAGTALADIGDRLKVVNCNEFITLREEPSTSAAALDRMPLGASVDEIHGSTDGFLCVCYRGQTGYALSQYLAVADDFAGKAVDLTAGQRYNVNLFLSNFTEQRFMWRSCCYDESVVDPGLLTRFAIDHCWFNRQNRLEWGDYFNGNNVRLPESQIAPVVQKYFGVKIAPSHAAPIIMDYKDGYYYWQETGGHINDGFACLYNVEALGGGRYCVGFNIYGMGEYWNNDVCYYDISQAQAAYPGYGYTPVGRAVIDTGATGLDDRGDWHIERYAVNYD